jgi:hypothetical protein
MREKGSPVRRINRTSVTDWVWRHQTKLLIAATVALVALVLGLTFAQLALAAGADPTKFGENIHDTTMENLKPIWGTVFPVLAIVLGISKERRNGVAWLTLGGAAFATFLFIWAGTDIVSVFKSIKTCILDGGCGGKA